MGEVEAHFWPKGRAGAEKGADKMSEGWGKWFVFGERVAGRVAPPGSPHHRTCRSASGGSSGAR